MDYNARDTIFSTNMQAGLVQLKTDAKQFFSYFSPSLWGLWSPNHLEETQN